MKNEGKKLGKAKQRAKWLNKWKSEEKNTRNRSFSRSAYWSGDKIRNKLLLSVFLYRFYPQINCMQPKIGPPKNFLPQIQSVFFFLERFFSSRLCVCILYHKWAKKNVHSFFGHWVKFSEERQKKTKQKYFCSGLLLLSQIFIRPASKRW